MTLANDTGRQEHFKAWLQRSKSYSQKTAKDANSRAKRAERLVGEPLDSFVKGDPLGLQARLTESISRVEPSKEKANRLARGLHRSVQLYAEFTRAR